MNLDTSTLDAIDASFTDNGVVGQGGAISAINGSTVTIEAAVTFTGNDAGDGGAIAMSGGTLTIDSALFSANTAGVLGQGGSLWLSGLDLFESDRASYSGDPLDGADEALEGGAWYLSQVDVVTADTNSFSTIIATLDGGAVSAVSCPSVTFTDTVAVTTRTQGFGYGGFLYNDRSNVAISGGSFSWGYAMAGAVVASTASGASTTSIDSVVAAFPNAWLDGGLAFVDTGGSLDVVGSTVIGGNGVGGVGVYGNGAGSLTVTDSLFEDNASSGGGGVITSVDTVDLVVERNALCGNADPWGVSAITVQGPGAVTNNRLWNNLGVAAGFAAGSLAPDWATFTHNTLVDNGSIDVYLAGSNGATLSWNLFAPGAGNTAVYVDYGSNTDVGDDNFVEDGATAVFGAATLGTVGGVPAFQVLRPFTCDDDLWVRWDDPVLVDFTVGGSGKADIDGTAPDYGAWGGLDSYPSSDPAVWDVDSDGVRNDVDCAPDDAAVFYGAPASSDCDCDSDGDGWLQPSCALDPSLSDCDDGDAGVHPQAADSPADAVDADCDGATNDCDLDGDGYVDAGCTGLSGDDCDDLDPGIHPGAPDAAGDEVDADCDGQLDDCVGSDCPPSGECDFDGDGWFAAECLPAGAAGADCDDADESVNPAADDRPGDSVDGNCDGNFEDCAGAGCVDLELFGGGGGCQTVPAAPGAATGLLAIFAALRPRRRR